MQFRFDNTGKLPIKLYSCITSMDTFPIVNFLYMMMCIVSQLIRTCSHRSYCLCDVWNLDSRLLKRRCMVYCRRDLCLSWNVPDMLGIFSILDLTIGLCTNTQNLTRWVDDSCRHDAYLIFFLQLGSWLFLFCVLCLVLSTNFVLSLWFGLAFSIFLIYLVSLFLNKYVVRNSLLYLRKGSSYATCCSQLVDFLSSHKKLPL